MILGAGLGRFKLAGIFFMATASRIFFSGASQLRECFVLFCFSGRRGRGGREGGEGIEGENILLPQS